MNNPNQRKQSGLTFWKNVRMIHHHVRCYEVLIVEFSGEVYESGKMGRHSQFSTHL